MPHQQFSRPRSFARSPMTASSLHKHASTKPEPKYDVLPHQKLFRRRGVSQTLYKEQQFNPKAEDRTSSKRAASLMNVLPQIKRQGFDIRDTRSDKVRISTKMRRCP